MALGCVWEAYWGASGVFDMVVGQGEAHIELGSEMAMEVLGLGVQVAGSGSPVLPLTWAAPDGVSGVR